MKLARTDWKYLIDSLMFICILGMAGIGLFLGLVIPRGTAADDLKYFLGLHRHQWGDLHLFLSAVFITLLCVHLVLEWNWIKGKARQLFKRSWKIALMVTLLAAFLVPFLFWLLAARNDLNYREHGRREGRSGIGTATSSDFESQLKGTVQESEYFEINGRMTLSEVEKATGVPFSEPVCGRDPRPTAKAGGHHNETSTSHGFGSPEKGTNRKVRPDRRALDIESADRVSSYF